MGGHGELGAMAGRCVAFTSSCGFADVRHELLRVAVVEPFSKTA